MFQLAHKESDMSTLIGCFESFGKRALKDLSPSSRSAHDSAGNNDKDDNEDEDEDDNDEAENESWEWACVRALYCLRAFVSACGEALSAFPADLPSETRDALKAFAEDKLVSIGSEYQQLAEDQCGEDLFNFLLQCMATLCPIYGYLGLQAEQARIAFFICKATLPSMKPEEAMKNSPDFVFDSRNLAAIEALSRLTKGNGEGVENVWKLVEATMEVIEEYIPEKDQSNNYVRVLAILDCSRRPLRLASVRSTKSSKSRRTFCWAKSLSTRRKAVETEMGCDLVIHTLEMMLQAARSGVSSEVPSGKANLMKAWDEVLRSAGLEEKVKIPHSSPIQTASGLKHLLAIANTNISRLERLVQTTESLTPRETNRLSSLVNPVASDRSGEPAQAPPVASWLGPADLLLHLRSDGAGQRQPPRQGNLPSRHPRAPQDRQHARDQSADASAGAGHAVRRDHPGRLSPRPVEADHFVPEGSLHTSFPPHHS